MNLVRPFFEAVNHSYTRIFALGVAAGVGLELVKVHFAPRGITYYKVFKRNNLHRELDAYEQGLKQTEQALVDFARQHAIPIRDPT